MKYNMFKINIIFKITFNTKKLSSKSINGSLMTSYAVLYIQKSIPGLFGKDFFFVDRFHNINH